uniref:Photoactivated adenylate cyclase subunit beta-like protein ST- n=1 Tax=Euglena gracilis TaxID=3039 RepID=PBLST_EUGGR|nr:RecName: Full=Photoactivated adenylate cyclase subunit beta-like protein ST- [Euglena gracilis]CAJ57400.1 photoactivated adenylate cyclase-like protein, beta subunit [Euglena gracilis]
MYILVWKKGQQIKTFHTLDEAAQFKAASNIDEAQMFSVTVASAISASGGSTEATNLRRLMYLSKSTNPEECNPQFLAEMARVAFIRNREIRVSGFLMYSSPFFIQVIVETDEDLDFLFAKISADPRHEMCIVLANGPGTGRMYGDWHMKDSHLDSITTHTAMKTILYQIARSFSSMWIYLQKSAANMLMLGKDPAAQPPERRSVVVTFIYLVEFCSIFSHPNLTEKTADVLSTFVYVCVKNVEGSGGNIAKFIPAICMTYWPIIRTKEALTAIQQISEDLAQLRSQQAQGSAVSLRYSQAGVHYGRGMQCNAGSRKSDFTLLGDCINTTSRIATLAKKLKTPLLFGFEVRCLLGDEKREEIEGAGIHQVKGRDKPVVVYQFPGPDLDVAMVRQKIEQFTPGRFRCQMPVVEYEALPISQRPPIFDDTPKSNPRPRTPGYGGRQRSDSLVDRLIRIANLSGFSESATGDTTLTTLTYISQATRPMSRLDLSAIMPTATRRNAQQSNIGTVLHENGLFVQTLEGPKDAVVNLYLRIRQDPRHTDVTTVHMAPLQERVYTSEWTLTLATEEMLATFPPVQDVLSQLAKSYTSLETYVPSTVVRYLTAGNNPRNLMPVSCGVVMLATDISSFTSLTEISSFTEVWMICNTFIDACTSAICQEGGEVIKLIGDCVTPYFPGNNADLAVAAAQELFIFCRQLREAFVDVLDVRGCVSCAVGMDYGQVVMAQCGLLRLSDYVAAGAVSAGVVEVEAITREVGYQFVVTVPDADRVQPQFRDYGIEPTPQAIGGLPCYGIVREVFDLPVESIKRGIKAMHAARSGEQPLTEPEQAKPDFRVSPGRDRHGVSGRRSNSSQGKGSIQVG